MQSESRARLFAICLSLSRALSLAAMPSEGYATVLRAQRERERERETERERERETERERERERVCVCERE